MSTRNTMIVVVLIAMTSALAGLLFLPYLPAQFATHWGVSGQANGYSSVWIGILLMPAIILGMSLILLYVPKIDPRRANIERFRGEYNGFVVAFAIFFAYIQVLTLAWNLGVQFNMNRLIVPAMGIFIFYSGILIGKAKQNYFIGIRTPWTLDSNTVWEKTHQRGGLLFKAAGLLALLGWIWPEQSFVFLTAPLLLITAYIVVYSYVLYRREKRL